MNIREQFEDWYVREYPWGRDALSIAEFTGDDECGRYTDMSFAGVLSASWKAWQAASKASEQQLTESRREFTAANATIHNLELKMAQVVADNAGLKSLCEVRRIFIMNGVQLGYIKVPTVEADPALETIRVAVSPQEPTPATDAYLAEMRAQGVDAAIEQLHKKFEGTGHIGVPVMVLESFAAQLRQGAEHE